MQGAFAVRCTESAEKWQLYTYNCWQVEGCAELFNNIGLLSVSVKGTASAAWCSSRDLFHKSPDSTEKHFHHSAQKDTKANDPYLSRNLLLTPHVSRIFTLIKEK